MPPPPNRAAQLAVAATPLHYPSEVTPVTAPRPGAAKPSEATSNEVRGQGPKLTHGVVTTWAEALLPSLVAALGASQAIFLRYDPHRLMLSPRHSGDRQTEAVSDLRLILPSEPGSPAALQAAASPQMHVAVRAPDSK